MSPTVLEKTSDRPKPTTRAARVSPPTPSRTEPRAAHPGPGAAATGPGAAPTEPVQPGQRGGPGDDGGEADALAGHVQRDDAGQGEQPGGRGAGPRRRPRRWRRRARSPRSRRASTGRRGRSAGSRPRPRARALPRRPPGRRPSSTTTLAARPGRRSSRFTRLAVPATRAVSTTTSTTRVPPGRRRPSTTAAARPLSPTPTILTVPLVTRPWRSAARCPRNPRACAAAVQVVVRAHQPRPDAGQADGEDAGGWRAECRVDQTADDQRTDGHGPLEQGHRLTGVVGPGPPAGPRPGAGPGHEDPARRSRGRGRRGGREPPHQGRDHGSAHHGQRVVGAGERAVVALLPEQLLLAREHRRHDAAGQVGDVDRAQLARRGRRRPDGADVGPVEPVAVGARPRRRGCGPRCRSGRGSRRRAGRGRPSRRRWAAEPPWAR